MYLTLTNKQYVFINSAIFLFCCTSFYIYYMIMHAVHRMKNTGTAGT